jgi:hypothetical protein
MSTVALTCYSLNTGQNSGTHAGDRRWRFRGKVEQLVHQFAKGGLIN